MEIKKYKSKYHRYIFTFYYNPSVVSILKQVQASLGWQAISYYCDDKIKGWAFSSLKIVLPELLKYFTIDLSDEVIEDAYGAKSEEIAPLQDEDLTAELVIPTKKPLFDFQIKAIDFVNKVGGKALLALPMGTGKSCTAIGYGAYKRYGRVLIICPASVKENWKREVLNFSGIDARILTEEEPGGWQIINYEQLKKYSEYLKKQEYDLVIVDESQKLKNKSAIRTKEAFKLLKKAKDVIFLSGTPIMNRPIEIYTTFNFIIPTNYFEFCQNYCNPKKTTWGWDFSGASNLDELKRKMWWMHRKTKEELLPELPEKTVNVLNTEMKDWKEYKQVLTDFRQWLKENSLSEGALYAEALTKTNYLKQVVVKNKNVSAIIDDFIENNNKMIVFSQYRGVIDDLHEKYKDISVKLTGETKVTSRQKLVDDFQNNENVRIFFSTIQAGGVGITLTKADTVVFTDLLWTPADHHQAEDRAHRYGQKNNVNVYYLITNDTIEEKIWAMLKRKETMVNKVLSGEENVRKVHIKSLLKNL